MRNFRTKPLGQAKPFTADQVTLITDTLMERWERPRVYTDAGALRNAAIFRVGIDTMLRVSDLAKLKVGDVSWQRGDERVIHDTITIRQKKTGRPVRCLLSKKTQAVLSLYLKTLKTAKDGTTLFPICTRSLQRVVKIFADIAGVDGYSYSPHSLRRTKASIIYKATGDVESVRQLLGHSDVSATSAYLGISNDHALELAAALDI